MENEEKLYLVTEQGEIVNEIDNGKRFTVLNDGDRVIRSNSKEKIENSYLLKYDFVKINKNTWYKVIEKYPIMTYLACYINYMDNILIYSNGKGIRYKDIAKVTGVSLSTVKRQMKGMLEEDVVHKVEFNKKTYLVVNPFICMRGRRVIASVYEEFKDSVWSEGCEGVKGYK